MTTVTAQKNFKFFLNDHANKAFSLDFFFTKSQKCTSILYSMVYTINLLSLRHYVTFIEFAANIELEFTFKGIPHLLG